MTMNTKSERRARRLHIENKLTTNIITVLAIRALDPVPPIEKVTSTTSTSDTVRYPLLRAL
jgi:hypothetical protein